MNAVCQVDAGAPAGDDGRVPAAEGVGLLNRVGRVSRFILDTVCDAALCYAALLHNVNSLSSIAMMLLRGGRIQAGRH